MKTPFAGSSGLCCLIDYWDDWTQEGLWMLKRVVCAAILLRLHESRLYGERGHVGIRYSQEFMEWATQWLG